MSGISLWWRAQAVNCSFLNVCHRIYSTFKDNPPKHDDDDDVDVHATLGDHVPHIIVYLVRTACIGL